MSTTFNSNRGDAGLGGGGTTVVPVVAELASNLGLTNGAGLVDVLSVDVVVGASGVVLLNASMCIGSLATGTQYYAEYGYKVGSGSDVSLGIQSSIASGSSVYEGITTTCVISGLTPGAATIKFRMSVTGADSRIFGTSGGYKAQLSVTPL